MTIESHGEFSVYQFFADGTCEPVRRYIDPKTAVEVAHHYCNSVGARAGITRRVIITDGGDFTNFEWKFGEGVTYPPRGPDGKCIADGSHAND
jgi:hypothetical protein